MLQSPKEEEEDVAEVPEEVRVLTKEEVQDQKLRDEVKMDDGLVLSFRETFKKFATKSGKVSSAEISALLTQQGQLHTESDLECIIKEISKGKSRHYFEYMDFVSHMYTQVRVPTFILFL